MGTENGVDSVVVLGRKGFVRIALQARTGLELRGRGRGRDGGREGEGGRERAGGRKGGREAVERRKTQRTDWQF